MRTDPDQAAGNGAMGAMPRRGPSRFAGDAEGVAAVEFALLALPFFMIVFVIFQAATIFFLHMSLTYESQRMARLVRTGQALQDNLSAGQFRTALCGPIAYIVDCSDLKIDLRSYGSFDQIPKTLPIANGVLDTSGFGYEPGMGGRIMALRVYYEWPLIGLTQEAMSTLANGKQLIAVTNVFKTEPF